uniref:Mitochondrial acidic protein MAM33 n=1 Tax=Kalanchoe fedtschenkoi TaxID=63787 RepID=A0A7N0TPZ3_KALFE
MLRRGVKVAVGAHAWCRRSSSVSSVVDSMLLRSLKDHYMEASKTRPPPRVSPPEPFSIVEGAIGNNGPVLRRTYGKEEINVSVMRLANVIPDGGDEDDGDDGFNQLFVHVDVSKPGQKEGLHFFCGLYPDALGIHSVSLRPKPDQSTGFLMVPSKYNGPAFGDLDEKMKEALHEYIDARGINESLFPFLQAWLYVKDHRKAICWFKSIGSFIKDQKQHEA